jgi:hypothetical protein
MNSFLVNQTRPLLCEDYVSMPILKRLSQTAPAMIFDMESIQQRSKINWGGSRATLLRPVYDERSSGMWTIANGAR